MPIVIHKLRTETPLEALTRLRKEQPQYEHERLSYAGRLDPMADGILLVLVGDENYERDNYLNLDKTYEVEILWGIATDTHDVLGKITVAGEASTPSEQMIVEYLQQMPGVRMQKFPAFSSKPVNGVSAFDFSKRGGDPALLPEKEIEIYGADFCGSHTVDSKVLYHDIRSDVVKISGAFRQEAVLRGWNDYFLSAPATHTFSKVRLHVSSGTYVRSLVHEMGEKLGVPALAYRITRTKIGAFS